MTSARYRFVVAADGDPEWLHVRVDVTHDDGEERSAELVLLHGGGEPLLVAATPVDADAPMLRTPAHPDEGVHR